MTKRSQTGAPTWGAIVLQALRAKEQLQALSEIYDRVAALAPERVASRQHWRAKVRQQLQFLGDKGLAEHGRPGFWTATVPDKNDGKTA